VRPLAADLQQIIHSLPASASATAAASNGNGHRSEEAADEEG
jgi:hypothetical protein